uniref:protein acetyllysine N-acetyltransferase n=1 Tax=Cavia porcellus TaxID=10141 RepID=A0A286XQU1_CAVPO
PSARPPLAAAARGRPPAPQETAEGRTSPRSELRRAQRAAAEREVPAAAGDCPAAAAEAAAGGEREAQGTTAVGGDNGPGLQGLALEPPPTDDDEDEDDDEGEEEEEAAAAIGYRDNLLLSDELITNGFHSCESDEDDRASHASSSDWTPRPRIGPYTFVQQHLMIGTDPRTILKDLLPETIPPPELDDMTLWQIVINILSEPPKRKKRKDINTIEDAVKLLQECKKIIVLTGAGVSVSCGIPDFRSRDGIYARLAVDFPDLPDPQAMFDIEYFRKDPRPFFKFAKEIYPGQFQPSLCHQFIALSDKEGKLLRNYTQNIDTLEQVAGIQRIIQCHGSFATASCLICKYKVDCEAVRGDIFNQVVPRCPRCPPDEPLAIMKPEIVFFGENLPEQFHRAMKYDKDEVDLLIVIGSSLKVRPVALIPSNQYLFLPPNRYIFHGAEVYSDSEDDVLSSSSCGSNSDSGTCQSPSLEEPLEDESEIEEFYNGLEDDPDVPEISGGTGFGVDGGDQEAVSETISMKQEVTDMNCPSNKS